MEMSRPFSLTLLALALAACDGSPEPVASPAGAEPQPAQVQAVTPSAPLPPEVETAQAEPREAGDDAALKARLLGLKTPAQAEAEAAAQAEAEAEAEAQALADRAAAKKQRAARRAKQRARESAPDLMGGAELPGVGGGLSDGEFQSAVGDWSGIKSCLVQKASRMASRSGALRVSFQIAADGSVAESKVLDTSNAVAMAIAPCVERRARRLRFPSFDGDEVTKVAKFVF